LDGTGRRKHCDLFDLEWTQRRERAAKTRLKLSKLPAIKHIDNFKVDEVEGVGRKKLAELASLAFIERNVGNR